MAGPDVLQLWIILNNMPPILYQLGKVATFWRVYMGLQLGGLFLGLAALGDL